MMAVAVRQDGIAHPTHSQLEVAIARTISLQQAAATPLAADKNLQHDYKDSVECSKDTDHGGLEREEVLNND